MANKTWNVSSSDNWNVIGDWLGGVPGPTDVADITQTFAGAPYTVTVSDAESVGTLVLTASNASVQVIAGGTLTLGGILSSDTISVVGGLLNVQGASSLGGAINISLSGTAEVPALGATITFLDSTGTLELSNPKSLFGTIDGFQIAPDFSTHDSIELLNFSATSVSANGGTVTVNGTGGPVILHLNGNYEFGTSGFFNGAAQVIGSNTFLQTNVVACYAEGTHLATPRGEVAIEDLTVGDAVTLARGGEAEVVWVGHRFVDLTCHQRPGSVRPIRVARGAFGPGRPNRDLILSPNHAVYIEDVLIPIGLLENGATIKRLSVDQITYWHVELRQHDIVLAEGLPAESYLDVDGHAAFSDNNVVRPISRFAPDILTWRWEVEACAPLVTSGPVLNSVSARLGVPPAPDRQRKSAQR